MISNEGFYLFKAQQPAFSVAVIHEFIPDAIRYQKNVLSSPPDHYYPYPCGRDGLCIKPNQNTRKHQGFATMKQYLLITTLLFSLELSAQNNLLFDTSKIDANTKLIGRYDQSDKQKTYQYLNFIIEDSATIKKVLGNLILGDEIKKDALHADFRIDIVQNFHKKQSYLINPVANSLLYYGNAYSFNIDKVKALAEKYPFDYRFDELPFNNQKQYDEYEEKQERDKFFLFGYVSSFAFEGSFEIQFPRNEIFRSPSAIHQYLVQRIEQIVPKGKYSISYILDERNLNDVSHYIITIHGSRKLYEQLRVENLKNHNWKQNVAKGYFFYRTT